jgi:hypothetical protein
VKGNDWHRKNGGKHVSAAPVSFEKSSHPSRDTQRSSWGRCNHTATSHSLSFSDLRRGTSASPLPSRTSRRRYPRARARRASGEARAATHTVARPTALTTIFLASHTTGTQSSAFGQLSGLFYLNIPKCVKHKEDHPIPIRPAGRLIYRATASACRATVGTRPLRENSIV